jgi:hypothetical protein
MDSGVSFPPSFTATHPMIAANFMEMKPSIFYNGMQDYGTQSMPWVSNHFSHGMSDMSLHFPSSVLPPYVGQGQGINQDHSWPAISQNQSFLGPWSQILQFTTATSLVTTCHIGIISPTYACHVGDWSTTFASHVEDLQLATTSHVGGTSPVTACHTSIISPTSTSHVGDWSTTSESHVEDLQPAAASHAGGTSPVSACHTGIISPTSASHVGDWSTTSVSHV